MMGDVVRDGSERMMDERVEGYYGFDLGDGESAVAWAHDQSSAAPMLLEIGGRKNALTAVAEAGGRVTIGEQAFLVSAEALNVRFKSAFLTAPERAGRLIEQFAAAVLDAIKAGGQPVDAGHAAFFVGCPSGWPEDVRARYRACFERAGLPNVTVISESRAAFMFARESGELKLSSDALNRPTLIIDAGSSTTDFTFINQLVSSRALDFGETALGGGLIDQMLMKLAVSRHPDRARIEKILETYPPYAARCEIEARKVKEMYFTRRKQPGGLILPCESSVKLYAADPPITVDIAVTDADMRAILVESIDALGGQSYLGAYRHSLKAARQSLRETPPELILLTGGASRMAFMADVAREVFPNAQLVLGAEPEFAIARGLCYALRIDRRTARFEKDVKALIESTAVEDIVSRELPGLLHLLAPVIADELIAEAAPTAFRRWRRGEVKTIDDMSGDIGRALEMSLNSGALNAALEPVTRAWLTERQRDLERLTDPICARCMLPLTSLRLNGGAPVDGGKLDIDAGQILDLGLIQTVIDVTIGAVTAALLGGGGVALLMAGPIGLVLSFVIGFVASRLGTTLIRRHIGSFNLPVFMRTLFSATLFDHTLSARKGELTRTVEDQLLTLTNAPDGSAAALNQAISGAIEGQLMEMAAKARLLIH